VRGQRALRNAGPIRGPIAGPSRWPHHVKSDADWRGIEPEVGRGVMALWGRKRRGSDPTRRLALRAQRRPRPLGGGVAPPSPRLVSFTKCAAQTENGAGVMSETRTSTLSIVGLPSDPSRRVAALRPLRGCGLDGSCVQPVGWPLRAGRMHCM
jgi:hypothetical protein